MEQNNIEHVRFAINFRQHKTEKRECLLFTGNPLRDWWEVDIEHVRFAINFRQHKTEKRECLLFTGNPLQDWWEVDIEHVRFAINLSQHKTEKRECLLFTGNPLRDWWWRGSSGHSGTHKCRYLRHRNQHRPRDCCSDR